MKSDGKSVGEKSDVPRVRDKSDVNSDVERVGDRSDLTRVT